MIQSIGMTLKPMSKIEIRNLIDSSINDKQFACLSLGKIRYTLLIFHKTVPYTGSKLRRNKIMESSHCVRI